MDAATVDTTTRLALVDATGGFFPLVRVTHRRQGKNGPLVTVRRHPRQDEWPFPHQSFELPEREIFYIVKEVKSHPSFVKVAAADLVALGVPAREALDRAGWYSSYYGGHTEPHDLFDPERDNRYQWASVIGPYRSKAEARREAREQFYE